MKLHRLLTSLVVVICTVGCGGGSSSSAPDMTTVPTQDLSTAPTGDMALLSQCGHPGDTGNSVGVGKFCMRLGDCTGQKASLCSALGNGPVPSSGDTYFCTIYPCTPTDAGTDPVCGENAACECGSGGGMSGCACTPSRCLGP